MSHFARRIHDVLIAPRAAEKEDRRRELALNGLLLASLVLALVPGVQRAVQISAGGPETADHVQTITVLSVALAGFGVLLVLSRRGRPVQAAWGLLGVYYGIELWSFLSEGPQKYTTLLISMVFVVTAGVLCGSRVAFGAAGAVFVTLVVVTVLESSHLIASPSETFALVPDAVTVVEIAGAFGVVALLLSMRTRERSESVDDLVAGSASSPLRELRTSALTVRELQVVRLIVGGRSNADISQELIVSPRTVHSHVSSALRKTGCANRTELAVLAVQEGLVEPGAPSEPAFPHIGQSE